MFDEFDITISALHKREEYKKLRNERDDVMFEILKESMFKNYKSKSDDKKI